MNDSCTDSFRSLAGLAVILVLLNSFCLVSGETSDTEKLRELVKQSNLRGVAVAWIGESGEEPTTFFYSKDEPVDGDTVFRAGSVSKLIVSLLALRAAEAGVLSLDEVVWTDPKTDFQITLAQLLEHTSGIPGSSYSEYVSVAPGMSPAEYVEGAERFSPRWEPGQHFSYSNGGYALAGAFIAEKWGGKFDLLLRREVFAPLGMNDSHFAGVDDPSELAIESYQADGKTEEFRWVMSIRPAGALHTTLSDLSRLLSLLIDEGRLPDGSVYLSEQSIQRMHRGETSISGRLGLTSSSYGLGNFGFLSANRLWRGHWGKTEGFLSTLGYLSEENRGFIILTNTANGRGMAELREKVAHLSGRGLPDQEETNLALEGKENQPAIPTPGTYVKHTHEMPFRSWIFRWASAREIGVDAAGVTVSGLFSDASENRYLRTEEGWFRQADLLIATGVFYEKQNETFWISGDSWKHVSGFRSFLALFTVYMTGVWLFLNLLIGLIGSVVRLV
ncbi:MAG: serine hydrolase domain-containing protein, partial [Verrucomicrobiota bacterium]